MTTPAIATLINLLAYITGAALYAMLLKMSLERRTVAPSATGAESGDRLPLLTALLGLVWNLESITTFVLQSFGNGRSNPWLMAVAFTALGFLPAVVVHSLLQTGEANQYRRVALVMVVVAYGLSVIASGLHFDSVMRWGVAPSHWALHLLTFGFAALTVGLLLVVRQQGGWQRVFWVAALALFSVSALHLSHHEGSEYSWWIEIVGHHSSLPLALVILYQDYRFALADIFLKRALSLVLLVGAALGLYLTVAAPLLRQVGQSNGDSVELIPVVTLIGLWVLTALLYPWLWKLVVWFVDVLVLRRADYEALRTEIAERIAEQESADVILEEVCDRLGSALTARQVNWALADDAFAKAESAISTGSLIPLINKAKSSRRTKDETGSHELTMTIPTAEAPQYRLLIGELVGGRRLLSGDWEFLESVALILARRIDAVRVVHERCERDLHEQEVHKLATEAELRALRAQINPHFLFNALTTIGYLIQTSPDRALETLMRLTTLLRGVLRRSDGEFVTLEQEVELIESYLDIERARFEDRLSVTIDVPQSLLHRRIPALLIQPLVENAIKHGISPRREGGAVVIQARLMPEETLQVLVSDDGNGIGEKELERRRKQGIGLQNVEQRVKRHYGSAGRFSIRSAPGEGTTVELTLPLNAMNATPAPSNQTVEVAGRNFR
ncbi:MAG: histidine kinase [Blastocatellia bacterium]